MIYLLTKVLVWLVLAFLLGLLVGWLLRRFRADATESDLVRQLDRHTSTIVNLKNDLATSRSDLDSMQQVLGGAAGSRARVSGEMESLREALARAQALQEDAERNQQELGRQLAAARNDLATAEAALAEAQADRAERADSASPEGAEADDLVHKLRRSEAEAEQARIEAQRQRRVLTADIERLSADLARADRDTRHLRTQLDVSQKRLAAAPVIAAEPDGGAESAGDDNGQRRRRAEAEAEQGRAEAIRQRRILASDVERLSSDLARTERTARAARTEVSETRTRLDDANALLLSSRAAFVKQINTTNADNQRLRDMLAQRDKAGGGGNTGDADALRETVARLRHEVDARNTEIAALQSGADNTADPAPAAASGAPQAEVATAVPAEAGQSARPGAPVRDEQPATGDAPLSAESSEPAKAPAMLLSEAPANPDDLKRIKGVGPKLEGVLNELGIYRFEQVAQFSPEDVQWVDERVPFKGRILRDDWIGQARKFAAE